MEGKACIVGKGKVGHINLSRLHIDAQANRLGGKTVGGAAVTGACIEI